MGFKLCLKHNIGMLLIRIFWRSKEADGLSGPDGFILTDGDQGDGSTWQTGPQYLISISMKLTGDLQMRKEADGSSVA